MTGNELIVDYLTSVPAWYLATVEDTPEGAQPHVRPFSFAALQDGEIQFCTATTKDCYREMQANPRVELTAWKPGRGWVILRGRANLEDRANAAVREEGFKHMVALGEDWDDRGRPAPHLLHHRRRRGLALRHRRLLEPHRAVEVFAHHFVDIRRIARGRPLDAVQSHL